MPSTLHQITMSHSAEEDRPLLRISTLDKAEFQFWLTRRFVNVLWPALMTVIEKENPAAKKNLMPAAKKAVVAMEHQEAVAAADFTRDHDEGNKDLTPGPRPGPLLVFRYELVVSNEEEDVASGIRELAALEPNP